MTLRMLKAVGLAIVPAVALSQAAGAAPLNGSYRGMIVCEKMKNAPFMLRAPFDVTVNGNTVIAARPIFNLRGNRVVGSEIASGAVANDGTLKLTSSWKAGQSSYEGSYGGSLTEKGGTLIGTQAWKLPGGAQMRACTVAVVQVGS